jgi:DNA excision repair protein ERCC-2
MCMAQRTHQMAHAPTGLGKTAVALTAATETALLSDGVVLFLTSRQSQHAIAIETMRAIWARKRIGVVDLISREDMCLAVREGVPPCLRDQRCFFSREPDGEEKLLLDYPLHTQEAMRSCLRAGLCPHRTAMVAAAQARVIIADYNQLFGRGLNLLQRLGRSESDAVVVIDEGHNLPSRVMGSRSGHLTMASLRRARTHSALRHFAEDLDVIAEAFGRIARKDPANIVPADLDEPLKRACGVDCGGLGEEIEMAAGGEDPGGVAGFLHAWSFEEEVTVRYLEGDPPRLAVSLIDPSPVTAPVLSRVRCALVMSGTLHPPEMFADLLGARNAICRSYPSPFPEDNRLVLASGRVSSRYRSRGQTAYVAIAEEIAKCAKQVPGNVAVFFPSYEFMGQVEGLLPTLLVGQRVLVERREHGKTERDALLAQLKEGRNLLLGTVGGSFAEGVDLKGNLLGAVFVVGLPLSPPSLEMDAMLRRMERRYGTRKAELYVQVYPAVAKVLQAAGRAIRSEQDRAAIVLMDDRYLTSQVRNAFPQDFRVSGGVDIPGRVGEFFS